MEDFFEGIDGRFPWRNCSLTVCYREDIKGVASVALAAPFFQNLFYITSGHLAMPSGYPDSWLSRLLTLWSSDPMVFWPSGLLVIQSFGLLAIRSSGQLIIRPSDHLVIQPSGHLDFWPSDHPTICWSVHPTIRSSGHPVIGPSQLLAFCPNVSKMSLLG